MRNVLSTAWSLMLLLPISIAQPIYSGFTAFPALNSFEEAEDCWGIYNQKSANDYVLDDLFDQRDRIGIVPTAYQGNNFFAVQDMKNPSNPSGQGGFLLQIDISEAGTLDYLSIDMGAMGNWNRNDRLEWTYRIDEGPYETAFLLENDPDMSLAYTLSGGNVRLIDNPLKFSAPESLKGHNIGNKLRTYSFKFEPETRGQTLSIYFVAQTDGANEIYCFDDLTLLAEKGCITLTDGPVLEFQNPTVVVPDKYAIETAHKRREEREEALSRRDFSRFFHYD